MGHPVVRKHYLYIGCIRMHNALGVQHMPVVMLAEKIFIVGIIVGFAIPVAR